MQIAKHLPSRKSGHRFYFLKNLLPHLLPHRRTITQMARFFYTDTIDEGGDFDAEAVYEQAEFGRLAREAFHDLINHLSAAKLYLNLAEKEKDIRVNKRFNGIKKAIRIMRKTEKFVLAIKKQINHRTDNCFFSTNKEIKQIVSLMSHKSSKHNIKINLCGDETIKLYGNSTEFGRIFLNLINNAVDAYAKAPNRNKKLIKIYALKRPHNFCFIVKDYACGIKPENLNRIFDEFFTTKKSCGGSGIGLFSIRKIIENKFHGHIKAKSCWRKGSSFIIKIPRNNITTTPL